MKNKKYTDLNFNDNDNIVKELEKLNSQNIDLSNTNLKGSNLENINLVEANLNDCDLSKSNLKNASLYGINLEGSNLFKTDFKNANLNNSNLKNCNLLGVNFEGTKLRNVHWGPNYKVINEIEAELAYKNGELDKSKEKYKEAEDIYREIKISMQNQTLGEETGKFFIREMIAKRKQLNRFSIERIGSKIIDLTTGYGEKISNIIFTIIGVIIFCMFIYGLEGIKYSDPINGDRIIGFFTDDFKKFGLFNTLGNLFYFSVVVYSTVGFGEMLPIGPIGKSIMIFEGILGGLILAILIIALYKKSMDR